MQQEFYTNDLAHSFFPKREHRLQGLYRKEVCDMISEGAIVGMLLDSHDLDGIVAQLPNAGAACPAGTPCSC